MADGLRLELPGAHRTALGDFRGVIEELLVRDWSALLLGGRTVLAMRWNHRHSTDLDFAWTALHRPPLWARVSGRLLPEERARIVRECRSIARSRKGRRTGRPVLRPSDPELARDVWATCARLLEAGAAGDG